MNLSERLRLAIDESPKSRYRLAIEAKIAQSTLCRFMQGGGLRLEVADRLADLLELELLPRASTPRKGR